ncbi:hypothetical protein B0H63DRAFT_455170 [Podospora didyma]|uniref:Uncharacterized protein n=1 Tax=Podospora didyma TaxID=330526 RepID=A0AAE0K1M2_9PEZI|nr:hypothetical protein B0H63DRAFT_455170 [Podospora didyma]
MDPRDEVFSILELASETKDSATSSEFPKALVPDYERPAKILFRDVTRFLITSSDTLDILSRQISVPERPGSCVHGHAAADYRIAGIRMRDQPLENFWAYLAEAYDINIAPEGSDSRGDQERDDWHTIDRNAAAIGDSEAFMEAAMNGFNWSLMVSQDRPFIVLGLRHAQKGDIICILFGGSGAYDIETRRREVSVHKCLLRGKYTSEVFDII